MQNRYQVTILNNSISLKVKKRRNKITKTISIEHYSGYDICMLLYNNIPGKGLLAEYTNSTAYSTFNYYERDSVHKLVVGIYQPYWTLRITKRESHCEFRTDFSV